MYPARGAVINVGTLIYVGDHGPDMYSLTAQIHGPKYKYMLTQILIHAHQNSNASKYKYKLTTIQNFSQNIY